MRMQNYGVGSSIPATKTESRAKLGDTSATNSKEDTAIMANFDPVTAGIRPAPGRLVLTLLSNSQDPVTGIHASESFFSIHAIPSHLTGEEHAVLAGQWHSGCLTLQEFLSPREWSALCNRLPAYWESFEVIDITVVLAR